MKVLLGITLLIVCVQSAALVKRSTGTTGSPKLNVTVSPGLRNRRYAEKPDLSLINGMRRAVAKAGGITNMEDLVWDEMLVAEVRNMDILDNFNEVKHGPNYRFFMDGTIENAQKMIALYYTIFLALDQVDNIPLTKDQRDAMKALKDEFERKQGDYTFMLFELFNPTQTKIGCAESRWSGVLPGELAELATAIGITDFIYSFDIMCAIGPNPLWNVAQLQQVAYAARQVKVMDKKTFIDFSKPAPDDEDLPQEESPEAVQETHPPPPPRTSPKPPTTPESANGESQKDTESSGSSISFQLAFIFFLLGFLM